MVQCLCDSAISLMANNFSVYFKPWRNIRPSTSSGDICECRSARVFPAIITTNEANKMVCLNTACTPKFFTVKFANHSRGVSAVIISILVGIPHLSDPSLRYSHNIHTHEFSGIPAVPIPVHTTILQTTCVCVYFQMIMIFLHCGWSLSCPVYLSIVGQQFSGLLLWCILFFKICLFYGVIQLFGDCRCFVCLELSHCTVLISLRHYVIDNDCFRFTWVASGVSQSGTVRIMSRWGPMAGWYQMEWVSSTSHITDRLLSGWQLKDDVLNDIICSRSCYYKLTDQFVDNIVSCVHILKVSEMYFCCFMLHDAYIDGNCALMKI